MPSGELKPKSQEVDNSTAMDNSQQSPPAQAQAGPLMRCCQKTNIRDCDCLVPEGPCEIPEIVITHYERKCLCYSCQWIRDVGPVSNCALQHVTYAGNKVDNVYKTNISKHCTDLEYVYPTLVHEETCQWGWVFQVGNYQQLPYLVNLGLPQCDESAERVTVGSDGKWKAIRSNSTSFPLILDTTPHTNTLYLDYGYHPDHSPVSTFYPDLPRSPPNLHF